MSVNQAALFSAQTVDWATPEHLYRDLDAEFAFNDDPCPLQPLTDGLAREWGSRTYVNPPYGREIPVWIEKALAECRRGKLVVMLLPSRTDTQWWHEYVMKAAEIRFIRGRLKFGGATINAPFPSAVVIFRPGTNGAAPEQSQP